MIALDNNDEPFAVVVLDDDPPCEFGAGLTFEVSPSDTRDRDNVKKKQDINTRDEFNPIILTRNKRSAETANITQPGVQKKETTEWALGHTQRIFSFCVFVFFSS